MRLVKLLGPTFFRASLPLFGALSLVAALENMALAQGGPFGSAPEIDPGSMCGALTLLIGGALLLTSRRSQK